MRANISALNLLSANKNITIKQPLNKRYQVQVQKQIQQDRQHRQQANRAKKALGLALSLDVENEQNATNAKNHCILDPLLDKEADSHNLSICSIFNREDDYLVEWVEFHLKQGVEHFYLYDNGCQSSSYELLLPYIEQQQITYIRWPDDKAVEYQCSVQKSAYYHCLKNYKQNSKWIAFIDLDEFLYSTCKEENLVKILNCFNDITIGHIQVERYNFGNSGHLSKPNGGVISNYTMREKESTNIKSIVNTSLVNTTLIPKSVHYFTSVIPKGISLSAKIFPLPFKINHYLTKSTQEYRARNQFWIDKNKQNNQNNQFNQSGIRLKNLDNPELWNQVEDKFILSRK